MIMIKYVLALILLFPFTLCVAAGNSIALDQVHVNINNTASIKRGARFYAKNCMVCHAMRYFIHNKIADQAGITLAKMPLDSKSATALLIIVNSLCTGRLGLYL